MTNLFKSRRLWNEAGRWAWLSTGIVILVSVFHYGFRGWPPSAVVLREVTLGFLVSFAISALAWTLMPRIAHRVWHHHVILRWTLLVITMTACGAAGLSLAVMLLAVLGVLPGTLMLVVFRENIAGVVTVTLILGTAITIFGSTRARLEATEGELQRQRLERERAEKLAAEARLASLASRVHPHFLFNTLNSISALVREDPTQAERTIERLSGLLRSSLEGEEEVPLEQELKLVTDYLEIQRTRLGDRLRFDISAAGDGTGRPKAAMVPPFSIQTLVENSVRHAGEKRTEGVDLMVSARRAKNETVIEVTDNGPGFDPDALKAGHGLDILAGRLRALYGERAKLEFNRNSRGMTVRLQVPAV